MQKGQSAAEYLLILGGAVALVGIVTMLVLNVLDSGQGGTDTSADALQESIAFKEVGETGVKIRYPLESNSTSVVRTRTFNVKLTLGTKVDQYRIYLQQGTSSYPCIVVTDEPLTGKTRTLVKSCTASAPAGIYDLNLNAERTNPATPERKSDLEKAAVTVTP